MERTRHINIWQYQTNGKALLPGFLWHFWPPFYPPLSRKKRHNNRTKWAVKTSEMNDQKSKKLCSPLNWTNLSRHFLRKNAKKLLLQQHTSYTQKQEEYCQAILSRKIWVRIAFQHSPKVQVVHWDTTQTPKSKSIFFLWKCTISMYLFQVITVMIGW